MAGKDGFESSGDEGVHGAPGGRAPRGGPRATAGRFAVAAAAGAYVSLAAWLSASPGFGAERVLRLLPSSGIVAVLVVLVGAHSARLAAGLADRGAPLEVRRRMAEADLLWARRMQWALAALLAFFLYRAFTAVSATFDPLVFFGALSLPLAGIWLHLRRVRVPRAAREARALGPRA